MSDLPYANHFTDLVVWRKARRLAKELYDLSREFPREEKFALTDQIRRSSRSIGAPIAEAWAKRRYEKHFKSKLTDADGEQNETQHWLITAFDSGHIDQETTSKFGAACKEIGAMLGKMISLSQEFCLETELPNPPTLRQPPSLDEFFILDHQSQTTDY